MADAVIRTKATLEANSATSVSTLAKRVFEEEEIEIKGAVKRGEKLLEDWHAGADPATTAYIAGTDKRELTTLQNTQYASAGQDTFGSAKDNLDALHTAQANALKARTDELNDLKQQVDNLYSTPAPKQSTWQKVEAGAAWAVGLGHEPEIPVPKEVKNAEDALTTAETKAGTDLENDSGWYIIDRAYGIYRTGQSIRHGSSSSRIYLYL